MADAVEVAIGKALLSRLAAFAALQSPVLTVAYPNVDFIIPTPSKTASWLRATIMPADTIGLSIGNTSTNQHYGLFQIDIFQGQGIGEPAPLRIAASLISYFARGTSLTSDGFIIRVFKPPFRTQLIKDDPWVFIPVRVPYIAFANPA